MQKRFLEHLLTAGLLTEGQAHRIAIALELASAGEVESLSGGALGEKLGISRAAVQKHVLKLRDNGFPIVASARIGYRLAAPFSNLLVAEAVLPYLLGADESEAGGREGGARGVTDAVRPSWIAGLPYRYVHRCVSTNALLRETAASSPAGALVVADAQTGGRGRLGRTWSSGAGKDLTFSLLVRPELAPARAHLLSLAAALAVAETLECFLGPAAASAVATGAAPGPVGIKWPNDVMVGRQKICGILLEGSMDADRLHWAIIGIGLNVNSESSALTEGLSAEDRRQWAGRPEPVSLRACLGEDVPRAPLLAALLGALTRRLGAPDGLLEGLRRRDVLVGHPVEVFAGPGLDHPLVSGVATGIGPDGQLLVRTAEGQVVPVYAGDVTLRASVNP